MRSSMCFYNTASSSSSSNPSIQVHPFLHDGGGNPPNLHSCSYKRQFIGVNIMPLNSLHTINL